MTTPNIKANDLEILWVAPIEEEDRVPTAQELAASSHLHQQNLEQAQRLERPPGLRNRPVFAATVGSKGVIIPAGLTPYAPGHPALAALSSPVTVTLPSLANTSDSISRYDRLYLVVFAGVVTGEIDADINLAFEWANQSGAIQTLTQENTRRLRTFWAIASSQGILTSAGVVAALPTVGGKKVITGSTSLTGLALNATVQLYARDPNLLNGAVYEVVADTVEAIDLCRVWRVQNFNQTGYVWGRTGEADFEPDFHIQPTYTYVGAGWDNWEARTRETWRRILLGLPLINAPAYDRVVQNLINGNVSTNLTAPGTATSSPNGSTALSNRQRVSFTNQAIVQKTYCLAVATSSSVGGFAQASVPFQTNSPAGSFFSQAIADHKVYRADGRDVTLDGTITGAGGTGALIWTANANTVVAPGDFVYMVPGIFYPAGSGFACTGEIEKVYLDDSGSSVTLAAANVRQAWLDDVGAYAAPVSSESYFVVLGKERAALHYILKRITISSTSAGVVAIPGTENGTIAFISGAGAPSGRIDKPVVDGLNPSTTYQVLVYYPPKSTEKWQFQFKASRYAGTQEIGFIDGFAIIATNPIEVAHTQGGGNNEFLSDADWQYEAIGFRLPTNSLNPAVDFYQASYKVQFPWEDATAGVASYREVCFPAAAGLAKPKPGMMVLASSQVSAQTKSIAAAITSGGKPLGFAKPPIRCAQIYQAAIAVLVQRNLENRVLVFTSNEGTPSQVSAVKFDSEMPSYGAMDTFTLY